MRIDVLNTQKEGFLVRGKQSSFAIEKGKDETYLSPFACLSCQGRECVACLSPFACLSCQRRMFCVSIYKHVATRLNLISLKKSN
jgi:hypothetical protein